MRRRNAFHVLMVAALATSACAQAEATENALSSDATPVTAAVAPAASDGPVADVGTVVVFKTPSCGCCVEWVDHMRAAGFTVEVTDANSLSDVKRRAGVPDDLQSCHTAIVDGLVVEGHVPASTVREVLAYRNGLKGIAVPGMPVGSPGMEVPGGATDAYDVIGFTEDGTRSVVSSH